MVPVTSTTNLEAAAAMAAAAAAGKHCCKAPEDQAVSGRPLGLKGERAQAVHCVRASDAAALKQ